MALQLTPALAKIGLNLYPAYLGAGIRVKRISTDWLEMDLAMKLRWYNRNYFGTQFGGSLYSMVDPHLALLLAQNLGKDYVVWDRAAQIEFLSPGRGEVRAAIRLTKAQVDNIRVLTADGTPSRPEFAVAITDLDSRLIARVYKTLYVKRKLTEA